MSKYGYAGNVEMNRKEQEQEKFEIDPKYKHKIGEFKCTLVDCQGHRKKYQAFNHPLYEKSMEDGRSTRRAYPTKESVLKALDDRKKSGGRNTAKFLQKEDGTLYVSAKRFQVELPKEKKGPKTRKSTKVKTTEKLKPRKKKSTVHYHKGRQGRCACPNP